jgi:riboflavin synthase
VNLEPAVAAGSALGGHFVTGHVDGVATVRTCAEEAGSLHAEVEAPGEFARFIAEKGSVTLEGVSLTVGRVSGAAFAIDVIPHTRKATTLGGLAPGQALNLEVDLLARYLDRLLEARGVR